MRVNSLTMFTKLFFFASIVVLASCKKEEPEPTPTTTPTPTPTTPSNAFYAEVDGVEFQESVYSGLESNGTIVITASENNSFPSIGIAVPSDITAGTYTFSGSFGSHRGLYNTGSGQNEQFSAASGTGTLVITSHDMSTDVIQGTFNFTASPNLGNSSGNSYSISQGEFTMNY